MESKELPEDELPVQLLESISNEASEVAKEKCSSRTYSYTKGYEDGYFIGATSYATWKVKHDELVAENERLKKELDVAIGANENLTSRMVKWQQQLYSVQKERDELKERCEKMEAALRQFISYHETGLLPDVFTYKKGVEALKEGESNTPAPGEGDKEITMSYTKGEWYLQKYTDAYTNIIRCNNGKHETLFIASTPQSTLSETRANAKLMSAAPDLLEALQEIIAITDRDHIAWVKAKAAIQKAIGNENQSKTF